jgi:hypothetical protein
MRSTIWTLAAVGMALGCSSNPTPSNAPTASAVSAAHTMTLTGRARTVAGRAVLFATDGRRLQIAVPSGAWPPGFEGRLVVVSGDLQPNPSASGAADDLEIVVNAQVKLLE